MNTYITPNDKGIISDTDSHSIQNAVNEAIRTDVCRVLIPRINERTGRAQWDIDEAIILSSNIEIVLDNCYIRQADGAMDNVFRNFDDEAVRSTLAEEQENIIIRGVGNAVIDGGVHNGLYQTNSMKDGLPHVEKNNLIRLHNLRDFRLENFTLLNQRWWAINLLFAEEGIISGLVLKCDNGCHNQDGIDLRLGCNNIIIENIRGYSGDDLIALSGFYGGRESQRYEVMGKSIDIHDIVIRNVVATSAECTVIGMRNQSGVRLYNITVDGVHDTASSRQLANESPSFVFGFDLNNYSSPKSPYSTIRIGQDGYYTDRETELGDVFGIHVSNIHSRTNCSILLNENIKDSYFGNIYAGKNVHRVVTTKSCRKHQTYGCDMQNVVFENIFYSPDADNEAVAFDFDVNTKEHTIDNVFIRNAFVGAARCAIDMKHHGTLNVNGLYGDSVKDKIIHTECGQIILDGEEM